MLCPAHMLGYLLAIGPALTRAVIPPAPTEEGSGVSRGSAFPAVCAGAKRSRRTSLRSPSRLAASKQCVPVFSAQGHSMLCLAHMLGCLLTICLALTGTIAPSQNKLSPAGMYAFDT
jgi:hypothetical protein